MKRKITFSYIIFFVCVFAVQSLYFSLTLHSEGTNGIYLLLGIVFLLTCFQLYRLISGTLDEDRISAELSALKIQQQMEEEQTALMKERQSRTLDLQSALRRELEEFEELLRQKEYPQAHAGLAGLTTSFEKERFRPYCEDNLIQAILDGKKALAHKNNIQVHFEIFLPETSTISSVDLSSVLFNLMDNGIEACTASGCPEPEIRLSVREEGGFLTVHMVNSKDPQKRFARATTKTDAEDHGLGLSIIQDICRNYDGSCQFEDQGDSFQTVILMRNSQ